jgi:ClpA/ClpB-like protein
MFLFEKMTDQGRKVIVLAQQEARDLNHSHLGTEHLLLGLLAEGNGSAAAALASLGVSLEITRDAVAALIGRGWQPPTSGNIPFTARSRKVLELAVREALQLGHVHIGTGHLLLAIARVDSGAAVQLLAAHGADTKLVRERVLEQLRDDPDSEGGYQASAGGYQASTGGYQVSTRGYQASAGGYQASTGGYQASAADYQASAETGAQGAQLSRADSEPSWNTMLPVLAEIKARLTAIEEHLGITPEPPSPSPANTGGTTETADTSSSTDTGDTTATGSTGDIGSTPGTGSTGGTGGTGEQLWRNTRAKRADADSPDCRPTEPLECLCGRLLTEHPCLAEEKGSILTCFPPRSTDLPSKTNATYRK